MFSLPETVPSEAKERKKYIPQYKYTALRKTSQYFAPFLLSGLVLDEAFTALDVPGNILVIRETHVVNCFEFLFDFGLVTILNCFLKCPKCKTQSINTPRSAVCAQLQNEYTIKGVILLVFNS